MPQSKRSPEERLKELEEQIQKSKEQTRLIEERKKQLEKKLKEEARRADAHRKIAVGAAVESVCHIHIEKEDIPKLLEFLYDQEGRGFYFSQAMGYEVSREKDADGKTQLIYHRRAEP